MPDNKPYTRLKITSLKFISAVDRGAQGDVSNVALIKRAPQGDEFEAVCKVALAAEIPVNGEPMGIVFGWALANTLDGGQTEHIDLQRDAVVGGDQLIKIAAAFMESGGLADTMHSNEDDGGRILFCFPLVPDVLKALGLKSDVHGLAVGMKPSPDTFRKFQSGELRGFSIAGFGERTPVEKSAKCAKCSAYMKGDSDSCPKCGAEVTKALWSTAEQDKLPDSSFLYIESGGDKDDEGKTAPRSLRHFPYKNADGDIDLPHLRNAIAQIPKSDLDEKLQEKLQGKAQSILAEQKADKRAPGQRPRVRKMAVLTSLVDGHQHQIDLDDPCDRWRHEQLTTSYNTAEGADAPHCHSWVFDKDTGAITIGADSGHDHTVDAAVPPEVLVGSRAVQDSDDGRSAIPCAVSDEDSGAKSGPTVVVVQARDPNAKDSGAMAQVNKYNPDQERDDHGRFGSGGGGGGGSGSGKTAADHAKEASAAAEGASRKAADKPTPENHEAARVAHGIAGFARLDAGDRAGYERHMDQGTNHKVAGAVAAANRATIQANTSNSRDDHIRAAMANRDAVDMLSRHSDRGNNASKVQRYEDEAKTHELMARMPRAKKRADGGEAVDANSPPSEATPTVDSDKEHAPMATDALQILTKKHEDLEKENTFLRKYSQLTDAEKAHHEKLVGQDKDVFLNKSALERQVEISEIAKADEVVYTSPVDGEVFRKSCEPRLLKMKKQADEATIALRVESQKRADGELLRKGAELLSAFSKGAKGNLQGRFMKAVNAEFTDPTDYEEAVEMLKGANAALIELSKPKGYTPKTDVSDVADPQAQLDQLVKRHSDEKNVSISKAYDAVLATDKGRALYAATQKTARA